MIASDKTKARTRARDKTKARTRARARANLRKKARTKARTKMCSDLESVREITGSELYIERSCYQKRKESFK
jgi:hypothetical protein